MELKAGAGLIRLVIGDITKLACDAIVNAANPELAGGGGVDGAIHRAGGPAIMMELNRVRPHGGCPAGSAVATGAGALPARWVIHAVGPVWHGGGRREPELLARAYAASLSLADERGASSVSLPSISTGAYGYPLEMAAPVALGAVAQFLRDKPRALREATFVLFDQPSLRAYERALAALEPR